MFPSAWPPLQTKAKSTMRRFLKKTSKCPKKGQMCLPARRCKMGRCLGGRGSKRLLSGTPVPLPEPLQVQEPPALQRKGAAPVTTAQPPGSLGARSPGEWAVKNFSGPLPSIWARLPLACQEPKIAPPCAQQQSTVPYSGSFHCTVALVLLHWTQLHIAIFNQTLIILCPAL